MSIFLCACNSRAATTALDHAIRLPNWSPRRTSRELILSRSSCFQTSSSTNILCNRLRSKYDIFVLCLHNRLLADEDDHMFDGVSGFQTVTSGHGVAFIPFATVLIRFSVNITAFMTRETMPRVCRLTDWLILRKILRRLSWGANLAVRQRLYFEHDCAPAEYEEDVRQWLKASRPGRWVGGPRAKYVDS